MKKHNMLKKMAAFGLAAMLVVGAAVPAFAAAGDDLTVKNLKAGDEVSAYQVLEYDAETGAYVLTDWAKTALGENAEAALAALTDSSKSNTSELAGYMSTLADAAKNQTAIANATAAGESATLGIADGILGSFLVIASGEGYAYTPMLMANDDEANETANAKKTELTLTKDVDDYEVAVGDTGSYTVKTVYPDFRGYTTGLAYKLVDTFDTNMKYAGNLKITVNGEDVTDHVTVTVKEAEGTDTMDSGFEAVFDSDYLASQASLNAHGTDVVMTYDVKYTGWNDDRDYVNKVTGSVKNNPFSDGYSLPEDTETVYSCEIDAVKVDANVAASTPPTTLAGAKFTVKNSEGKYVQADGTVSETPYEFVTGNDGKIYVKGLDADLAYTFSETAAPDGYSKVADFTVTFNAGENKGEYNAVINNSSAAYIDRGIEDRLFNLTVQDTSLGALPTTGGIGVYVVVAGGMILMLACGAAYIVSKKHAA